MAIPRWSPNRHRRPKGVKPFLIVLHDTEGGYEGACAWLMNPRARASAHFVVARDGRFKKLVPLSCAAWHVRGSIRFAGLKVNDVSIGFELEAPPYDYPAAQMETLCKLIAQCARAYGIEAIAAHKHLDPKRRRDPVRFPWRRFWRVLAQAIQCKR